MYINVLCQVSKQKIENKEARAKQQSRMRRTRHTREQFDYEEDKERKHEREGAGARRRRKPLYVYGVTKRRIKDLSHEKKQGRSEHERKFYKDDDLGAFQSGVGKVSELAKDLAVKFSGKEERKVSQSALKPKGFVVGLSHQAEVCYFCKEPVYLMERYTAEGLYFHQSCFQCHFCGINLRLATYSMERTGEGVARFFCPQHHGLGQKHRRPHRRPVSDTIPIIYVFNTYMYPLYRYVLTVVRYGIMKIIYTILNLISILNRLKNMPYLPNMSHLPWVVPMRG